MPLTCSETADAFKHIMNVVFQVLKEGPLYKALEKSGDNDVMTMISMIVTLILWLMIGVILKRTFPFQEVTEISSTSLATMFFIMTQLAIQLGMTGYLLPQMTLMTTGLGLTALQLLEAQLPLHLSQPQLRVHRTPDQSSPQLTVPSMVSSKTNLWLWHVQVPIACSLHETLQLPTRLKSINQVPLASNSQPALQLPEMCHSSQSSALAFMALSSQLSMPDNSCSGPFDTDSETIGIDSWQCFTNAQAPTQEDVAAIQDASEVHVHKTSVDVREPLLSSHSQETNRL